MSASNYFEAAVLNWIRGTTMPAAPTTIYVGLSSVDPAEAGTPTEPSGGAGYARQAVTFGAPVQGADAATISNTAEVLFGDATSNWGVMSHFFVADALTAGNVIVSNALQASRTVNSGDTARWAAGTLQVTMQ